MLQTAMRNLQREIRNLKAEVVSLLGGEAVGVQHHLLSQSDVCCCQVGDGGTIICRGLCHIGKRQGNFHGVVCRAGVVSPLDGRFSDVPGGRPLI